MIRHVLKEQIVVDSQLISYMIYDYTEKRLQVKYKSGKFKDKLKTYENFDSSALDLILQNIKQLHLEQLLRLYKYQHTLQDRTSGRHIALDFYQKFELHYEIRS